MEILPAVAVGLLIFYVATFVSGFWLRITDKPLQRLSLIFHVVSALATLAVLLYAVYGWLPTGGMSQLAWFAIALTALLYAGAIFTGVVVSIQTVSKGPARSLHLVLPLLIALGACASIALLAQMP